MTLDVGTQKHYSNFRNLRPAMVQHTGKSRPRGSHPEGSQTRSPMIAIRTLAS
ncbi:hypothetical protein J3U99_06200 [Brucella pituitosa]|uniref:hypothetical protein n=1 Tax=Brucella pituitosa TaxID=571256 RepID=UPI0004B0B7C3|nr:hypothetical protein [Brucella pituitosa]MCK4204351.1 hypothetical protein [Brucella pituitosa]